MIRIKLPSSALIVLTALVVTAFIASTTRVEPPSHAAPDHAHRSANQFLGPGANHEATYGKDLVVIVVKDNDVIVLRIAPCRSIPGGEVVTVESTLRKIESSGRLLVESISSAIEIDIHQKLTELFPHILR